MNYTWNLEMHLFLISDEMDFSSCCTSLNFWSITCASGLLEYRDSSRVLFLSSKGFLIASLHHIEIHRTWQSFQCSKTIFSVLKLSCRKGKITILCLWNIGFILQMHAFMHLRLYMHVLCICQFLLYWKGKSWTVNNSRVVLATLSLTLTLLLA